MKVDAELAECAKINFENLERDMPRIKNHPFYMMAKAQLDEALGYGTVADKIMGKEESE